MGNERITTMEEFAALSGISRPTLSKYFNDPASVRSSTREKIEAALKKYDYTPNIYAINQNRETTRNIGIVLPNLSDPFFAEMAREAEVACFKAGYTPVVLSSHGQPKREIANLEFLRTLKPAGVLMAPFGRNSKKEEVRRLSKEFKIVFFDSQVEGCGYGYFGTDREQTIDLMVDYLCRSGQPPCFFGMEKPLNPNARKLHNAYVGYMERNNLEPHVYLAKGTGWDFEEIGFNEGGRMMENGLFVSNTVFCSNDRLAIGMLAAAFKLGIRVGIEADSQMRIAGHDNHPFAKFTGPRLTTIAQDFKTIAHSAVNHLIDIMNIDQPENSYKTVEFPGELIMRDSA